MKRIYATFLILVLAIGLIAQTPIKKWQGASSNDWDNISANWVPVQGLPFPTNFVQSDDVILDDTKSEGQDSISVVGEIQAANVSFNNSIAQPPYALYSADATSKIFGSGAIYKENRGEVLIGVNTEMVGGIVVREGLYTANNPNGAINAFGAKVTFEGGSIKINKDAVDNPTYAAPFEIVVAEGKEGEIITPRRVNFTGKVSGSGSLSIVSNGERDIIDLTGGADWTGFTGKLNVVKGEDEISYVPGFYGLIVQTDSTYAIEYDDSLGTGVITESGVNNIMAKTKVHMGSGTYLGAWSGTRCFQFGELSGDEDATIIGYVKKSTTPSIVYRVGSSNTDFTLASRFTGEMDKGDSYRRYNLVGLVKVGTGTMRLTNPHNYITGMITVKEGKLFVSNPEGSSTGTGWLTEQVPLLVGPKGVLGGTGSISRNVEVFGSIEPGEDGVGRLTIQDSLEVIGTETAKKFGVEFKSVSKLNVELASATSYDVLAADSFFIGGGTLSILPAAVYDLKAGESYKILEGAFGLTSTVFDSIYLPFTESGWVWDTSNFYVDGSISLTSGGGSGTYNPDNPTEPTDTTGTTEPTDTTGTTEPGNAVRQYLSDDLLTIYPNPNNGQFTINLGTEKGTALRILNTIGHKVFEQKINAGLSSISLQNTLANGLYVVQVETPLGVISRRMLIQK
ncbi:MAG: T9SS type A sorting domain-containing protein [Prolixibacteraceae bacterium]